MSQQGASDEDIAELVQRWADAAAAFIRGDMRGYVALITHAEDYTLLAPFGGPARRGFDPSEEAFEENESFFTGGEASVELVQSYASGDLVVLVLIERQHGKVGGLPDQDWSLRLTLVFRRAAGDWQLVHRHADALTHGISLEQAAEIARG
jgi:ketosteroid isomerase-like protein